MLTPLALVLLLIFFASSILSENCPRWNEAAATDIRSFQRNEDDFAVLLFKTASKEISGNIVFSPTSIAITMGMLLQGAKGTTKAEIKSKIGDQLSDETAVLNNKSSHFNLSTANKMFVNKRLEMVPSFRQTLKSCFLADSESLDINSPDVAAKSVNDWVKQQTNGKIINLVSESVITPDLALLLVNAIYFKGEWRDSFETEKGGHTMARQFNRLDGSNIRTEFMTKKDKFLYIEQNNVQVLGIPYKNDELHMFIFLPKSAESYLEYELSVTPEKLDRLMDGAVEKLIDVKIPKFKLEANFPLKNVLKMIEMTTMFSQEADFSAIGPNLKVSEAMHKAFIEVNEKGTEAAAATYIAIMSTSSRISQSPVFDANRPFLFAIRHAQSGSLLFFAASSILRPNADNRRPFLDVLNRIHVYAYGSF